MSRARHEGADPLAGPRGTPLPRGEPELWIDYARWSTYTHRADDVTTYRRALVVGVGTSGVPAATRAIYLRERRYDENAKRFEASDPDLAAAWNPDGTLELRVPRSSSTRSTRASVPACVASTPSRSRDWPVETGHGLTAVRAALRIRARSDHLTAPAALRTTMHG